ncbi:MAG: type IX secretion system protein PorQ [Bacteroidota bacterium]|nr:type IX secretion system protein PorQ [Bacteroidota bacterium]
MTKRFLLLVLSVTASVLAFSQAGTGVYQFLNLPVSSRLAALGSINVSLRDNDVNFAFQNPALLTSETNNMIGLNMANYLADIKFGSAVYGRNFGDKNYFAVGIQYVDYGNFKYATEANDQIGDTYFTAKDMALNIMYARPLTNRITVGATLKPVYSVYETYTSYGLAMDAGVSYNDSANFFSAGLVLKNMGTQLKGYYSVDGDQHLEPLPFDIQLGISKKFNHAPLRLSMTLDNLQHWDLSYESTNQPTDNLTGTAPTNKIGFVDMAFRHAIFAAEFIPSKNFYLTAAYNDRRQQEMSMSGFKSMAGFSFGGGIRLYKFQVGFGMTQFQVGNYAYQFSISTSLNEFRL